MSSFSLWDGRESEEIVHSPSSIIIGSLGENASVGIGVTAALIGGGLALFAWQKSAILGLSVAGATLFFAPKLAASSYTPQSPSSADEAGYGDGISDCAANPPRAINAEKAKASGYFTDYVGGWNRGCNDFYKTK